MENKILLTERDLREIEMIYQTQLEQRMPVITLNRIDFKNLLDAAKLGLEKK